jgi:hypothetical protein
VIDDLYNLSLRFLTSQRISRKYKKFPPASTESGPDLKAGSPPACGHLNRVLLRKGCEAVETNSLCRLLSKLAGKCLIKSFCLLAVEITERILSLGT